MLKFTGKMEFYFGEVVLSHLEDVVGVSEEYVASFAVDSHELEFTFFEGGECFGIVTFNPTGLIERQGFPTALRAILMKQTVLYDLKLKLADSSYNLTAVELVDKQLRHAFVHELLYALVELFGFHRVAVLDIFEHFRREAGESLEVEYLTGSQGVADFEVARIGNTYDVAGICLVDNILFLSHKRRGRGKFHCLAGTYVTIRSVALKCA